MSKSVNMARIFALTATVSCISIATAADVITDNFESNTAADYTIVESAVPGAIDSSSTFLFDYVAAGIPLAPNSSGGDTYGLQMTANDTDNGSGNLEESHITAFHNTSVSGLSSYSLFVDIWMNVQATSGSTEFSHVGIAGDGATFNSIFTPISGSGYFLAMTGEGGSSSDFRHTAPGNPAVPSGDASYLNSSNTTNATGDTYQNIFPGGDFPGSPGNRWTTLEIRVDPTNVTYLLDGTPIIETANAGTDGQISLGYADVFDSVASPLGSNYVVYDNLRVTPEPSALSLLALGALAAIRRR